MMDVEIIRSGVAYPLLHWYQPDLWVDTQTSEFVLRNFTDTGAPYVGPQPNPGPSHSYVVLLFRQPPDYRFPQCFNSIFPISIETRGGFDLHLFIKMAGLEEPFAANYFTSQDPDSRVTSTWLSQAPCATKTWTGNAVTEDLHKDV
jgi:phosphatidylethanolamine-binding protein